jgi:hypothetical protein
MDRREYQRLYQQRRRAANPERTKRENHEAVRRRKRLEANNPALRQLRLDTAVAWNQAHLEQRAILSRRAYDKIRSTPGGIAKAKREGIAAMHRYRLNPIHAVRLRARWRASRALRDGRIVRGPCEVGQDCTGRIEMHHDSYARPLAVRWLCKRHHEAQHEA